jgi:hypothetical protein
MQSKIYNGSKLLCGVEDAGIVVGMIQCKKNMNEVQQRSENNKLSLIHVVKARE